MKTCHSAVKRLKAQFKNYEILTFDAQIPYHIIEFACKSSGKITFYPQLSAENLAVNVVNKSINYLGIHLRKSLFFDFFLQFSCGIKI